MRKQTKLVAVLSAAALLAIGASMTSMAAQGWQQEGDEWYYYDNNGDYVTDEWKKSGNNWYYLGDDGYMMKNYLLEDGDNIYYLDGNGVMVTNSWVAYTPDDDYEDDAPDHYWYYFQSNGRAVQQTGADFKKKTINGKTYGFDEDGRMLYGFVTKDGEKLTDDNPFEDAEYYFGDSDDGAMHKGWLQYMDGSDLNSTVGWSEEGGQEYNDLDEMWFYFNTSSGEKVYSDDGKPAGKTINGNKYVFDEKGVMISEWVSSISNGKKTTKYYNDQTQGWLEKKGWIWAIPAEDINSVDNDDETYRWFYAPSSGKVHKNDVKSINGKKYVFDKNGIMRDGLVVLNKRDEIVALIDEEATEGTNLMKGQYETDSDLDTNITNTKDALTADRTNNNELYYFSADGETDGSMKTGKNIKIELEDDEYTFAFEKNGKAYHGKEDDKIYLNGVLAQASSDYRYQSIITVGNSEGILASGNVRTLTGDNKLYDNYVVGTSGTIVKPGKYVKDSEDGYYAVSEKNNGSVKKGDVAYFEDEEFARDMAKDFAKCGKISTAVDEDGDYKPLGNDCN